MSSPVTEFELTVAGYARLFGGQLDDEVRSVLRDGVGDPPEGDWAAVFAYARYRDGTVEKVTIFTSEAGYAQRLAGAAGGRIPLPMATLQQRFPKVHPGWVIDNGELPPGAGDGEHPRGPAKPVPARTGPRRSRPVGRRRRAGLPCVIAGAGRHCGPSTAPAAHRRAWPCRHSGYRRPPVAAVHTRSPARPGTAP
jgi:hypothetical protein